MLPAFPSCRLVQVVVIVAVNVIAQMHQAANICGTVPSYFEAIAKLDTVAESANAILVPCQCFGKVKDSY